MEYTAYIDKSIRKMIFLIPIDIEKSIKKSQKYLFKYPVNN